MYSNKQNNSKLNTTNGCQEIIGKNEICGEVKSLDILKEFRMLYENKLREIQDECDCKPTRIKIKLFEEWVKDLTEQNVLLVKVVEELEQEASERVELLEEKLRNSSKTSFDIMKTLQDYDAHNITSQCDVQKRLMNYQSDINNLTEFIRRIRDDGTWNVDGLHFYTVAHEDLCRNEDTFSSAINISITKQEETTELVPKLKMELTESKIKLDDFENEKRMRDKLIQEQSEQIEKLSNVVERCASCMPDRQRLIEELQELRSELKMKTENFNRFELYGELENKNEHEEIKTQIKELESQNKILRQTISTAQTELISLRDIIITYNKEQEEAIKSFQKEINIPHFSDTMLMLHNSNNESLYSSETSSTKSETDLKRTVFLLKYDVKRMVRMASDTSINQLKKQFSDAEISLDELNSKEKLIKDKDEMIKIQNESLNLAQKELQDLRTNLNKLEEEKEMRLLEIRNQQQTLVLNQSTIRELKKTLQNSEEKGINIQQTENIKRVLSANEILEEDINYMKKEMSEVSKELKVLQELLKANSNDPPVEEKNLSVTKSLHIMREHSETLIGQLKLTQAQVSREVELNESNSFTILDLQKQLDLKKIDLRRCEMELVDTKSKLNISIRRFQDYEQKVAAMELQILDYQNLQSLNHHKNEQIALSCNSDLNCLKEKIEVLNIILKEKSDEILGLHAELSVKSDTISNLLAENKEMDENNTKIAHDVLNLENQLTTYKTRCDEINEKYKKCKNDLETFKKVLTSSQDSLQQDKNVLQGKLDASKKEEAKLNKTIAELKSELDQTKKTIKQKDDGLTLAQQEMVSLKEEINKLVKTRNKIQSENQKLQDQIGKLHVSTVQYENRNILISEQLEKCLQELNSLQNAKMKLEERNAELETEINHLQRVFGDLNQEIRYKNESVVNLEHELTETKCSRDEICAESRIVVNNVRSWLEEQKQLNVTLNKTVKENNLVIEELTLERNILLKNIKEICERYETLTEELHICRQYLAEMNHNEDRNPLKMVPMKRSVHTWGSQGSVSYDSSSPTYTDHQIYDYRAVYGDDANQEQWMQKVNNLNEDVKKTKKYWNRKLSESAKHGAKRALPVRENNSTKTN